MSQSRVSRVYAKALYQAAVDEGRVEAVRRDLKAFVEAVSSSEELRQLLVAEEVSDQQKKRVLLDITEGGDELMRNLVRLLVDKSREADLADIYEGFVQLLEAERGLVRVEATTAVPLPPALQEALKAKIESSLQKTVELTLTVDEEILGGIKLRIGDRIADASVRHRLERLHEMLTSPLASLEGSVEAAS